MKKYIRLTLLTSLGCSSLFSWGTKIGDPSADATAPTGGVTNPAIHLRGESENGYLKTSYLLFKPNLDDTNFTTKLSDPFNLSTVSDKVSPKSLHFDWSSGVRVNLGMYLPHYDQWDLGFITTYLYSDASNHASVPDTALAIFSTYLAPQLYQSVLGDYATKASGNWRMNFFTFDLGLGREFFLTPKITARPYLGVRGLAIYQNYLVKYRSYFVDTSGAPQVQTVSTRFSQSQEAWGVGVKAATDLAFRLPGNFSIFGNVGGSLLYGHFDSRQKVKNGRIHPILFAYNPSIKQNGYDLQTGLEGSFGLKWERWYPSNNNRVTLSAVFEAQHWFDMNKWARIDVTDLSIVFPGVGNLELPISNPTQLHGDLTIMGLTFALQWDF